MKNYKYSKATNDKTYLHRNERNIREREGVNMCRCVCVCDNEIERYWSVATVNQG